MKVIKKNKMKFVSAGTNATNCTTYSLDRLFFKGFAVGGAGLSTLDYLMPNLFEFSPIASFALKLSAVIGLPSMAYYMVSSSMLEHTHCLNISIPVVNVTNATLLQP